MHPACILHHQVVLHKQHSTRVQLDYGTLVALDGMSGTVG